MNFNQHYKLEGQHAFLGASKYYWVNYTDEKLAETYRKYQAIQRGTDLHELAKRLIELKVKLPKSKNAFNSFVNDAIGYRMTPELVLYYSDNAFGTADCISFRRNLLRIHDLKTGITPASMRQLYVYTALFCLEYKGDPNDIDIELRLYQSDTIIVDIPNPQDIIDIMEKIIRFDKQIELIKEQEE